MAASAYLDQVQQIYIAYLGRPADPDGLAFWANQVDLMQGDLSSVIAGFAASGESAALYGGMTSEQKVSAIYQNIFSRQPDPDGLAFWVGLLDSGAVSEAQAAHQIQSISGPTDALAVANKLAAANAFTAQIDTAAELAGLSGAGALVAARAFLSAVDSSAATLQTAIAGVATAVATATGVAVPVVTPPAAPTLVASEDAITHVVTLSGTATGDISISWAGAVGASVATFTREGAKATVDFDTTAKSLNLAATDVLAGDDADFTGLVIDGLGVVKLTANSIIGEDLLALDQASEAVVDATGLKAIYSQHYDTAVAIRDSSGVKLGAHTEVGIWGTAQELNGKAFEGTSGFDFLTVERFFGTQGLDLTGFKGVESIVLGGTNEGLVTIADGETTISGRGSYVKLGTGGQSYSTGQGADIVIASADTDTFLFNKQYEGAPSPLLGSLVGELDSIVNLGAGDLFKVEAIAATAIAGTNGLVTEASYASTGTLAEDIAAAIAASTAMVANGAALVTITGDVGSNVGSYLVLNDGTVAFDAAQDAVIQLTGTFVAPTAASFIV